MIDESTYGFLFSSGTTGYPSHLEKSTTNCHSNNINMNFGNVLVNPHNSDFPLIRSNVNRIDNFADCQGFRGSIPSLKESFNCCLTQHIADKKESHLFSQITTHETKSTNTEPGFIVALSFFLTQIATSNSSNATCDVGILTPFHSVCIPPIPIRAYLVRIAQHFGCSNECFVLAIIYVGRIIKFNKSFTLTLLNVHRVIVTAIMLATKFFDDVYYSNAFYAKISGVGTRELNSLEVHFLRLVKFQLFVTEYEYEVYKYCILRSATTHSIVASLPTSIFNIQVPNEIGKYNLSNETSVNGKKHTYKSHSCPYNCNCFDCHSSLSYKKHVAQDLLCNLTRKYAHSPLKNCTDNFCDNMNPKSSVTTYSEMDTIKCDTYNLNSADLSANLNLNVSFHNFPHRCSQDVLTKTPCHRNSVSFQNNTRIDRNSTKHELKNKFIPLIRKTYRNSPLQCNNQLDEIDPPFREYEERSYYCATMQYPRFLNSDDSIGTTTTNPDFLELSLKQNNYSRLNYRQDDTVEHSLEPLKVRRSNLLSNCQYFLNDESVSDIHQISRNNSSNTSDISFFPKYDFSSTTTAISAVNPTVNHYGQHLLMNSYNFRSTGFDQRLFV